MVAVPIIFKFGKEIGKAIKKNGKIALTALALPFIISNNLSATRGKLDIGNKIYTNSSQALVFNHTVKPRVSDGYDSWDHIYDAMFDPSGISSKIVSIVQEEDEEKELDIDKRPEESIMPANLELSIHRQSANRGDPVTISSENELWCALSLAGSPYFYDFGNKPITFWEKDTNDPNTLYFMADVREAIDKSDFYWDTIKSAKIPLLRLDGEYGSEVPYLKAKIKFNTFPGDFDLDGKVNLKDYAYWANCDPIADITGTNGLPDGEVDFYDLSLYNRDYLKDSNDPNTWRDFPYEY